MLSNKFDAVEKQGTQIKTNLCYDSLIIVLWRKYESMRLYEGIADETDYHHFLETFSLFDYEQDCKNFVFEYVNSNDENLNKLKSKYNYSNIIQENNEFRNIVQLMVWVSNTLIGDGMCIPIELINADTVLERTLKEKIYSNCYMYSVVLNEIYLSLGYCSRIVRCMPIDIYFNDCHCITEVYSKEYSKWIALDAANRAYYVDEKMTPLDLFEVRTSILENKKLYVPMMTRSKFEKLRIYLTKNLVRFESYKCSCFNSENLLGERTMFHFQSLNYSIRDKIVEFDNFHLKHIHTNNPNLFWAKPLEIDR